MPTPDRDSFCPYVRCLADALGLKDWTVVVADEGPHAHGAIATVCCTEGRKHATVRLSEQFLRDDEAEQRHTIAHELLHCQFAAHTDHFPSTSSTHSAA
jgi:ferritin-like protein